MRALHVSASGEQPVLADLPKPSATPGTVLIRVKAAGLNPIDNVIAAGWMAGMIQHEYPLVLGRDAAGVVEAVGEGVDHVAVGDEVIGHVLLVAPVQAGTLAEYAVLPATAVTPKPAGLDFTRAAALPLAATAAATAIDVIAPQAGQVVLVNGASGGVGSYAIQLLAARGVTVIATGTAAEADRLTKLGASKVVDYTAGPIATQLAHPVDALINLVGNTTDEVPLAAVRAGGKVATTTQAPDEAALTEAGLTGGSVYAAPLREVTGPLAEQAAAGALTIDVATVLPFERAAEGLATLAAGEARGKIVVTISE
jgi:NADPH:quinone reductase-like Zn-dependent oxidoreductase